jgi:adenylate cyclase
VYLHLTTQRVEAEQEKFRKLIFNLLPKSVATSLLQHGETSAQHFDNASVMFVDIVAFTQLAQRISPRRLVSTLNTLFSLYEGICNRHGLEKIKTIGDAFMCAAGVPLPVERGSQSICRAG